MISPIKNYPGSKANSGLYQQIINLMPEHDIYVEPFLGSGKILCFKKPARLNVGNDIDPNVYKKWEPLNSENFVFTNQPAKTLIDHYGNMGKGTLIYADPPYFLSSIKSKNPIYKYSMTNRQHFDLVTLLDRMPCHVILSGYRNELYDHLLKGWGTIDFKTGTHQGAAIETIWYNFPSPIAIHDSKYLGKDFTDRQRIKRKVSRWVGKFKALPVLEQNLIMEKLKDSHRKC